MFFKQACDIFLPSRYLVGIHELVNTNLVLVAIHIKLDILIHPPFFVRERSHSFADPRNQDLPTRANQRV